MPGSGWVGSFTVIVTLKKAGGRRASTEMSNFDEKHASGPTFIYRVGQNHNYTEYTRSFWQGITKYTVIYSVYIQF
jgi:hypothetical protein